MNVMDALSHLAMEAPEPGVVGQWRAVRLQLDPSTGEQVNVGVWFKPEGGSASWRLLRSVGGLRCMYGPDAAATGAFAIDQAHAAMSVNGTLPTNWTVVLGEPRHTQGANTKSVIDSLFQRLVPLARHEPSDEDRLDGDDHRLSTGRLRRSVRDIIKKRFQAREMPDFWRDSPVTVAAADGHPMSLDLQIWTESGTAVGAVAAIASAWYTSKFHRDCYLNSGYRSLSEARQVAGVANAAAGLYLLRPLNDKRFTEDQLRSIDNEIDAVHWLLSRLKVSVNVYDNELSLAEGVLAIA